MCALGWQSTHAPSPGGVLHEGRSSSPEATGQAHVSHQLHRDGPGNRRPSQLPAGTGSADQGGLTAA